MRKRPDAGPHGRDILLVLLRHPGLFQVLAVAMRATRSDQRFVALIEVVGDRPPGLHAVVLSGLATRTLRVCLRRAFREGRRLALARPMSFRKTLSQPSDFFLLHFVLFAQFLDLLAQLLVFPS